MGDATIDIPLIDLSAATAELGEELTEAVQRCIDSGRYVLGDELLEFEREFAIYSGTRHCVGVGSGLDALALVLRAWKIGPGDEVIVPAYTAVATWMAVWIVGARPVGIDVATDTYTLDPDLLEAAITERTRAVIPVHLFGQTAAMTKVNEIAARHKLLVLEDAAQAHGALYDGKRAGGLAAAAAFSFYPTKNLGGLGDGGAITTDDGTLAERCRLLRSYGWRERSVSQIKGVNSRLDELQAAILRVKLRHLDRWNERRREIANYYIAELADIEDLSLPVVAERNEHVWHLFVVSTPNRGSVLNELQRNGIGALVHYDPLPHLTPAFAADGWATGALPRAEQLAGQALSLPLSPQLERTASRRVVDTLKDCVVAQSS